jgi:hypothetical protein
MLKKIIFTTNIVVLSFLFSCASQPKVKKQPVNENLVAFKLGTNTSSQENENHTHILYTQKPDGDNAARIYKYAVVSKSDNKIVLDGSYKLGYVKWISNFQIEVLSLPSLTEQDEAKFKKVFSVLQEKL